MSRVTQYVLPNGVEWIADRDHDASEFHVFFTARSGRDKERLREREGMHLIEHMFFRSTSLDKTVALTKALEERRILSNGETGYDYCYAYFYGPTLHKKKILTTAFEGLTNSSYNVEEFELEKKIVLQELEMRRSENRWVQLEEKSAKELYGGSRYGTVFEDSLSTLPYLSLTQVLQLRTRLFRPENLTVITIGTPKDVAIDPLINDTFGSLKSARPLKQYEMVLPERAPMRREYTCQDISTCFVQHTLRCGKANTQDMAALYLLSTILAGKDTSILYAEQRLRRGLTYRQYCTPHTGRPEMLMHINYTSSNDVLEENISLVQNVLEKLATKRLSSADLRRYTMLAVDDVRRELEDGEARGGWYVQNAAVDVFVRPKEFAQMIRSCSAEKIRSLVEEWLPGEGIFIMKPESKKLERIELAVVPPETVVASQETISQ